MRSDVKTSAPVEGPLEEFTRTLRWRYNCPLSLDAAMEALYRCDLLGERYNAEPFNITLHPTALPDLMQEIVAYRGPVPERPGPEDKWSLRLMGICFTTDRALAEGTWEAWVETARQTIPYPDRDPIASAKAEAYNELMEALHSLDRNGLFGMDARTYEAVIHWKRLGEPGYHPDIQEKS